MCTCIFYPKIFKVAWTHWHFSQGSLLSIRELPSKSSLPESKRRDDQVDQQKSPRLIWPRDHGYSLRLHHAFQPARNIKKRNVNNQVMYNSLSKISREIYKLLYEWFVSLPLRKWNPITLLLLSRIENFNFIWSWKIVLQWELIASNNWRWNSLFSFCNAV